MAECYQARTNITIPCPPNTTVYFAVAVFVPLAIVIVVIAISIYFRCRHKRLGREQQQQETNMTTNHSIENFDGQQRESHQYPHPPRYSATIDSIFGKPPPYEQTIEQLEEVNDTFEDTVTIIPVTTLPSSSTAHLVQSS
ncbi:unnamed protein product [Rotaria sp. Silwood1]|nr:unnamed protein product [Rotaria sp. Silwood1]CAF1143502.1 unnamed protein product [Rotaria sp. Silwood1]CAF3450980.1 unnamed protein product [Rotaria sp. Silwood1]CAF4844307.1 unnamed protein product [Rotaria sp. Silwood1]CAF4896282.1 unnamed protein product [Rotaria sp. Silwood1]